MKYGTRWLAIAVLSLSVPAAAAADATSVVQQVEAKYATVKVLQADFVQTTRSEVFGEEKQSGNLVLKRPKQMLWNFTGSGTKQFVTDGKTMWVYTADDNQVIRYDDITASTSQADSLLQSLDQLDELFAVEVLPDELGHTLSLAPRQVDGHVKKLRLELSPELVVERVTITDNFDNVTELAFSAVKLDGDVPDTIFQFEVPAGAELISAGAPSN